MQKGVIMEGKDLTKISVIGLVPAGFAAWEGVSGVKGIINSTKNAIPKAVVGKTAKTSLKDPKKFTKFASITPAESMIHSLHKEGLITDKGLMKISKMKKMTEIDKTSSPKIDTGKILSAIMISAATAAVPSIIEGAKNMLNKGKIKSSYHDMKNKFPDLLGYPEDEVREKFLVLAKFAPSLAEDPMVAGTFVNEMMQYKGIDPLRLNTLIQAQDRISGSNPNQFVESARMAGGKLLEGVLGSGDNEQKIKYFTEVDPMTGISRIKGSEISRSF